MLRRAIPGHHQSPLIRYSRVVAVVFFMAPLAQIPQPFDGFRAPFCGVSVVVYLPRIVRVGPVPARLAKPARPENHLAPLELPHGGPEISAVILLGPG